MLCACLEVYGPSEWAELHGPRRVQARDEAETEITFSRRGLIWKKKKRNLRIAPAGEPLFLFLSLWSFPHPSRIDFLVLGRVLGVGNRIDLCRGNRSPAPWGSSRTSKPVSVLPPARARPPAARLGRELPQPHRFFF